MSSVSVNKGKRKREAECLCKFALVTEQGKSPIPQPLVDGVGVVREVRADLPTKRVLGHLLLLWSFLPLSSPARRAAWFFWSPGGSCCPAICPGHGASCLTSSTSVHLAESTWQLMVGS